MAKAQSYALLGDVPIHESQRTDLLKFSSYAKVLARATIETRDSITIGVFGQWGTGKTSLMRLIKNEVDDEESAVAVWFNAWQYEREEHLIVPLIATVNRELKGKKGAVKKLSNALRAVAYGFSARGKVGIPLVGEVEVDLSGKNMIDRGEELAKGAFLDRSLYFDAFEELRRCVRESAAPRIVVFVDDLDRCFPPKAVELLEGIKLVLNLPGFSFVLGVYERIIQDFIRAKYAKDYNIDPVYFEDYLDKIVQVKVPVPAREPDDMGDYVKSLIQEGRVFPEESIADAVPLIAEAGKRNPRSIIRLFNRILVTVRIGALEGKKYDPLALLLHIATDEPKYRRFRHALDFVVMPTGKPAEKRDLTTIGELLGDLLKRVKTSHSRLTTDLSQMGEMSLPAEFKTAVEVLVENEHLFNLLRSKEGLQWLKDSGFRHMLGQASERTLGEKEKDMRSKAKLTVMSDDPIRQLQDNMVRIEGGTFQMGSVERDNEQPVHSVTLEGLEIGAMPVTQAQYEAVMKKNPAFFAGGDRPIESVSWFDAMMFCRKLSEQTGQQYALPSEAQWEYACRAGSEGRYCFGDDKRQLGGYAWFRENSGDTTHPVGRKKPNDWGLYDMHGNVWEWCLDHHHGNYDGTPADGGSWEASDARSARAIRGGAWLDEAGYCRCSFRGWGIPDQGANGLGFRVVRVLRPSSPGK